MSYGRGLSTNLFIIPENWNWNQNHIRSDIMWQKCISADQISSGKNVFHRKCISPCKDLWLTSRFWGTQGKEASDVTSTSEVVGEGSLIPRGGRWRLGTWGHQRSSRRCQYLLLPLESGSSVREPQTYEDRERVTDDAASSSCRCRGPAATLESLLPGRSGPRWLASQAGRRLARFDSG
jgi:hypothetical protein